MSTGMNEMLETLNQAIADTPWWLPNTPALELVGYREVLGELGTRVDPGDLRVDGVGGLGGGFETLASPRDGRHTYSYTRAQCKRMRKAIREAADEAIGK